MISSFNSEGTLFAIAFQDTLKCWDVSSNTHKKLVPTEDLQTNYTCMAWFPSKPISEVSSFLT